MFIHLVKQDSQCTKKLNKGKAENKTKYQKEKNNREIKECMRKGQNKEKSL